jgi:Neurotransmitter-gated ion-channel ligand binding domain
LAEDGKKQDCQHLISICLIFLLIFFQQFWQDNKLKWNPEDYGGLTSIHLADHEVWQPDITLYNGASGNNIDHYGNTHAIVYPSGSVIWVPPTQFPAYCTLDLKLWPFDTQKCAIHLGSWTYHAYAINVTINGTNGFSVSLYFFSFACAKKPTDNSINCRKIMPL